MPQEYLTGSNQGRQRHAPTFHPLLFPSLPSQREIFFNPPCSLIYIPIESCYTTYAGDCLTFVTTSVADKVAFVKNTFIFFFRESPTIKRCKQPQTKFTCRLLAFILKYLILYICI